MHTWWENCIKLIAKEKPLYFANGNRLLEIYWSVVTDGLLFLLIQQNKSHTFVKYAFHKVRTNQNEPLLSSISFFQSNTSFFILPSFTDMLFLFSLRNLNWELKLSHIFDFFKKVIEVSGSEAKGINTSETHDQSILSILKPYF